MKYKLRFDKNSNIVILNCDNGDFNNIKGLIGRFGYGYSVEKQEDITKFYIRVNSKDDFKRLKSLWKSAQRFI